MSFSADLKKGLDAFFGQDYPTAWRELKPLADEGNADAQVKIGEMYHLGNGIQQDIIGAYKWFKLAPEQGNPEGQYHLGTIFGYGLTIPRNPIRQHMWFFVASSRRDLPTNIGVLKATRMVWGARKFNWLTATD